MKYEKMSDFEVNLRVGELVFGLVGVSFITTNPHGDVVEFIVGHGDERHFQYFDGCNKPSDAFPVLVENKINIEWRDSLKLHPLAKGTGGNACHFSDKNPLRAVMICFLRMKDAENGNN